MSNFAIGFIVLVVAVFLFVLAIYGLVKLGLYVANKRNGFKVNAGRGGRPPIE